jgi:hypothetical protein
LLLICYVRLDADRLAAILLYLLGEPLEPVFAPGDDGYRSTLPRKRLRTRLTDTAARARYERDRRISLPFSILPASCGRSSCNVFPDECRV